MWLMGDISILAENPWPFALNPNNIIVSIFCSILYLSLALRVRLRQITGVTFGYEGFRVYGLGFRVLGSGISVCCGRLRVEGAGVRRRLH